jgi:hypothetical protein
MMSRVNARNMQRSLINVLLVYVNKQKFSASSWRSNQGNSVRWFLHTWDLSDSKQRNRGLLPLVFLKIISLRETAE